MARRYARDVGSGSSQVELRVAPTCPLPEDLIKVIEAGRGDIEKGVDSIVDYFRSGTRRMVAEVIKHAGLTCHEGISIAGVAERIEISDLEEVRAYVSAILKRIATVRGSVELASIKRSGADMGLSDKKSEWAYYYFGPNNDSNKKVCSLEEYELAPPIRPIGDGDPALIKSGLDKIAEGYKEGDPSRTILDAICYASTNGHGADTGLVDLFSKSERIIDLYAIRFFLDRGSIGRKIEQAGFTLLRNGSNTVWQVVPAKSEVPKDCSMPSDISEFFKDLAASCKGGKIPPYLDEKSFAECSAAVGRFDLYYFVGQYRRCAKFGLSETRLSHHREVLRILVICSFFKKAISFDRIVEEVQKIDRSIGAAKIKTALKQLDLYFKGNTDFGVFLTQNEDTDYCLEAAKVDGFVFEDGVFEIRRVKERSCACDNLFGRRCRVLSPLSPGYGELFCQFGCYKSIHALVVLDEELDPSDNGIRKIPVRSLVKV